MGRRSRRGPRSAPLTRPVFHPLAERELLDSIDWYEGNTEVLGLAERTDLPVQLVQE